MTERAKTRQRTAAESRARKTGVCGSEDVAVSMAHVGKEG